MTKIDVLLGLQWGDEGKGKIVDVLTPQYDIITRFQGGPNAGHTLIFDGVKHILHTIPSGIFHKDKINVIGNGVLIDLFVFQREIDKLKDRNINAIDNLKISKKSHFILPTHRVLDSVYENNKGNKKIGSTLKGIGPAYTDRTARNGIRTGDITTGKFYNKFNDLKNHHLQILKYYNFDLNNCFIEDLPYKEYEEKWLSYIDKISEFDLIDSEYYINQSLKDNKKVLAEGAQGSLLDVDFGSYPFVTSSNTITAGVCSGLGVSPDKIGKVIGVFKAYCTRVGSGPFPTEQINETGEKLRTEGHEFGSTTGRPRRCGWIDIPALKYSIMLNGVTDLVITKIDVLNSFGKIFVCKSYNYDSNIIDTFPYDLESANLKPLFNELKGWDSNINNIISYNQFPENLQKYIQFIEKELDVPITMISNGPDRTQIIFRNN